MTVRNLVCILTSRSSPQPRKSQRQPSGDKGGTRKGEGAGMQRPTLVPLQNPNLRPERQGEKKGRENLPPNEVRDFDSYIGLDFYTTEIGLFFISENGWSTFLI